MMDIPANDRVGADVVVGAPYIYTFALALMFMALAASAILFSLIDF